MHCVLDETSNKISELESVPEMRIIANNFCLDQYHDLVIYEYPNKCKGRPIENLYPVVPFAQLLLTVGQVTRLILKGILKD